MSTSRVEFPVTAWKPSHAEAWRLFGLGSHALTGRPGATSGGTGHPDPPGTPGRTRPRRSVSGVLLAGFLDASFLEPVRRIIERS